MKSKPQGFVIFPYLRTSKPVNLGNIKFNSTLNASELTEKLSNNLAEIRALFFLDNHQQIEDMIYTLVDLSDATLQLRLEKTRAYLAFLYANHASDGRPFFGSEHTTFFIVQPGDALEFSVTTEGLTSNLWPEGSWPKFDKYHFAETPCIKTANV